MNYPPSEDDIDLDSLDDHAQMYLWDTLAPMGYLTTEPDEDDLDRAEIFGHDYRH